MSRHGSYDDWNSLYENEWPVPLTSYSKKWAWHFANHPYVNYVVQTTLPIREEQYKSSSPYRVSKMYKALHKNEFSGYVNALGNL